jgi:RNA polymerase sigma-70 factor, ECF subfamily
VTRDQDNDSSDRGHDARMRMAAGDEVFFKYYWPRLVRYLKTRAVDTNLAEDVAADAMMAFMDQWEYLLTHPRPDSWLFKVATRKLRKLETRARDHCCFDEDLASSVGDLQAAAANDVWIEDHLDLITGMRSLPSRQCEVIGLHYFGGYTLAETAEILDIHVGTVKKHLSRGLEGLRQSQGISVTVKAARRISA